MEDLSDTQIRANLRTLLAQSGIDPNQTSFTCTGGIVRMIGALLGLCEKPVRPTQLELLEQAIRKSRGVKRLHFTPENWQRMPSGEWREVGAEPVRAPRPREAPEDARS